MANRIWQGHFGDGIVRTPDNFGRLGERPSIPSCSITSPRPFIESGWSIKKMHRMIMLSKTYQMSAAYDEATKAKDPENRLLSHFPRQRLSIEEIRDAFLAIGGDLDLTMGGTLDPGVGTDGETSSEPHQHEPGKDQPPQHLSAAAPLQSAHASTRSSISVTPPRPEGHRNPDHRRHPNACS